MKEKKKGKRILFASFLRPTEELLWQSSEKVTLRNVMPKLILSSIGLLISAFATLVVINIGKLVSKALGLWGLIVVFGPGAFIFLLICMYVNGWMGQFFKIKFPDGRYAITSERLFYQRGEDIQVEALENIPPIDVLPDNILSFGPTFPQWTGLGNAKNVKRIIERARKERLKGLSMSDGHEYPLGQAQSYKNSVVK
jgi:hypothetical protein